MNYDKKGKVIRDSEFYSEISKKRKSPAYNFQRPEVQKKANESKLKYWKKQRDE